jgi:hypothetical protein
MYKIIGADGKEYGPITAEQLRQWIAEGRANALTRVLVEGTTEWKPLSEIPEFSAHFLGPAATPPGGSPPSFTPTFPPPGGDALSQVNGPATGLMVLGILMLVASAASLMMQLAGVSFIPRGNMPDDAWAQLFSGTVGVISSIISIGIGALVLFGGLKMKKLESFGLAVTASILGIVPCTAGLCCVLGLPIGVWALIVLFKPEVKSAFH